MALPEIFNKNIYFISCKSCLYLSILTGFLLFSFPNEGKAGVGASGFKPGYEWIGTLPQKATFPLDDEAIRCATEYTLNSFGWEGRQYLSYLTLNRILRKPYPTLNAVHQARLLEKARLAQPIYVGDTNGMTVREENGTDDNYQVGEVFISTAFMSASASPTFGGTTNGCPKGRDNVHLVIVPPDDQIGSGREFWHYSYFPCEREVLFGPGARFRVIHHEVYLREIPGLSSLFGKREDHFITLQEC